VKAILPNGQKVSPEPCGMLFYGTDKIGIDEAFRSGIPLKGHDWRLLEHVLQTRQNGHNALSAFRGTTVLANINPNLGQGAIHWAQEGGWVYHIGPMEGWNPEKLLEGQVKVAERFKGTPYEMELETSVSALIAPNQIYKAGLVVESANCLVVREWTLNPNYPKLW